MTKRFISIVLMLLLILSVFPWTVASAAKNNVYNPTKALGYAQKNWNNGVGLCAEFVSRCLQAGGVDVFYPTVAELYNNLNGAYGKAYKLTLTGGTKGAISMSANEGKLKKGDPVFYKCNYCGDFEHVVICNGANADGYCQDYAHNNAHNGKKKTYTYNHCGGDSWTMYSIRMYEAPKLYGAKSPLEVPEITSLSNGANGIIVKWDKTSDATSYRVYRKTAKSSWKKIGTVKTNSLTDTTCTNNQTYTYMVRAVNGKKVSQYYEGESVRCLASPELKSVVNAAKGITFSWKKVASADGYYVYRRTGKSGWSKIATVKGGSNLKYTDKTAKLGQDYSYTVKAYDGKLKGIYSSKGLAITRLTAPKNLMLSSTNEGMEIKFDFVKGATSYRIFKQNEKGKWKRIATVYSDEKIAQSYIDGDVNVGEDYTYTVRAVKGSSYSTYTSEFVTAKQIFDLFEDILDADTEDVVTEDAVVEDTATDTVTGTVTEEAVPAEQTTPSVENAPAA